MWRANVRHNGRWGRPSLWIVTFLVCLMTTGGAAEGMTDGSDDYIAGYAAGMLEHEFHLSGAVIQVEQGRVTVYAKRLAVEGPVKIVTALESLPGR